VGTQLLSPPIGLGFMGAPACELYHNFPLIAPMQVSAGGTLTVPWNVPHDSTLIGARVFTQCLVIAPGATPGGVVTTNALCVVLGN